MTPEPELADPEDLPRQMDDESKKLFEEYINAHKQRKENSRGKKVVTSKLCKVINDMRESGVCPSKITEHMPVNSPATIYYHLRGDCSHDDRPSITYDECCKMRIYSRRGAKTTTLAMLNDIDRNNVQIHILGKCSHEDGIEPLTVEEARYTTYNRTTSTCPICNEDFEHKKYRDRITCSRQCNSKYANNQKEKV